MFSHKVSLAFSWLWQFLRLCFLIALHILRSTSKVFCRLSLSLFFSWWDCRYGFGDEDRNGEVPFLSYRIKGMYQHGLSMTMLILIILLRLCLSSFSIVKLLLKPPTPFHTSLFGNKITFLLRMCSIFVALCISDKFGLHAGHYKC